MRVAVKPFTENVEQAARVRDETIMPTVERGATVLLDFDGVRFSTQSFVHALLNKVFRNETNMSRLSFVNCSQATKGAISLVAAYSTAESTENKKTPG